MITVKDSVVEGTTISPTGIGVLGESTNFEGVRGISHNPNHGAVVGICDSTAGGFGVFGSCDAGAGVTGHSKSGIAVVGESTDFEGVRGISHNPNHGGVVGLCDSPAGGIGLFGSCDAGTGIDSPCLSRGVW
jgi:hypothetical protein